MQKFNWFSKIHGWGLVNRIYRAIPKNTVNYFCHSDHASCFLLKQQQQSCAVGIGSGKCWESPKGLNSCEIFLPMLSTKGTATPGFWQLIKAPAQPFSSCRCHSTAGEPVMETSLAPGRFPPPSGVAQGVYTSLRVQALSWLKYHFFYHRICSLIWQY